MPFTHPHREEVAALHDDRPSTLAPLTAERRRTPVDVVADRRAPRSGLRSLNVPAPPGIRWRGPDVLLVACLVVEQVGIWVGATGGWPMAMAAVAAGWAWRQRDVLDRWATGGHAVLVAALGAAAVAVAGAGVPSSSALQTVAAATIEEVLFRGIVLCGIWQVSRRAGATPSIALAAGVGASVLAFVAQPYHLQQIASRPGLAVSFVASGVVLAMLVAVLRSLPAAIGVHVTLNAVALMAEAIELSTVGHAARTTAVLVVLGGLAALMWIRSRPTVIDITDEAVAAMRR